MIAIKIFMYLFFIYDMIFLRKCTEEKTMERVELKEISAKTTVKAIITGFVSYGIIAIFVCLLIFANFRNDFPVKKQF